MTTGGSAGTLQDRLARAGAGEGPVTAGQRAMVERSIRDAVAVAIAGAHQESARIARQFATTSGSAGPAWIWGTDNRVDPISAAFANGTAVQALEFDDIAPGPAAHMSSVMVPALNAVAHLMPPERAVDAMVHGLRAGAIMSGVISRDAYRRGLQPTHTIGPVAAVAAIGYGLELAPEQISHAIGLVATQALGLRANTGTSSKAMQAGLASAAAVRSILLVLDGAHAGAGALEAVLTLVGVPDDLVRAAIDLRDVEPLLLAVKLFPTCGAVHTALEATIGLRDEVGGDGAPPAALEVRVPTRMLSSMPFQCPTNPDEARFSVRYCVERAWRDGRVEIEHFTDEAVRRAMDVGWADWITVVGDTTFDPQGEACHVTLEVAGRTVSRSIEFREGYAERPLGEEKVAAKLRRCLEAERTPEQADEIMATLTGTRAIRSIGEVTAP